MSGTKEMRYDFFRTPEQRYRNDTQFAALVNMMLAHIEQCNYTPSEMREAAILASIMYERTHIREIRVPEIPKVVMECLDALHKWEEEWMASPSVLEGRS